MPDIHAMAIEALNRGPHDAELLNGTEVTCVFRPFENWKVGQPELATCAICLSPIFELKDRWIHVSSLYDIEEYDVEANPDLIDESKPEVRFLLHLP